MASIYWKGTDGAYSTNGNWSGGAIPNTNDNVRLVADNCCVSANRPESV